jgi:hypothetical protein
LPVVTTHSPDEAYRLVLAHAGATLPARDAVDQRIVGDVRGLTGQIIDSQKDVGGWPELRSGEVLEDSDNDGLPNKWEVEHGLDPTNNADARGKNTTGYTHLDVYLNELAAAVIPETTTPAN